MAAITFRTLRDYCTTYSLHVDCPACRHHARLEPMKAVRVVGWDCPLPALRQALRSSRCGIKGAEVRIVHSGEAS